MVSHIRSSMQQGSLSQFEMQIADAAMEKPLSEEQAPKATSVFQKALSLRPSKRCRTALPLRTDGPLAAAPSALQQSCQEPAVPRIRKEVFCKRRPPAGHEASVERPAKRQRNAPLLKTDAPSAAVPSALQQSPQQPVRADIPQERRYPLPNGEDTIMPIPGSHKSDWRHRGGNLFEENEIIERCNVEKRVEIGKGISFEDFKPQVRPIFAYYTKYGKTIIQQQGLRGCTAGSAGMLIMDHGKKIDITALTETNLGDEQSISLNILKAGLSPQSTSLGDENALSSLRKCIQDHGSAIVFISSSIGNHCVIVDDISEGLDRVRLRDPYHGWEVTVTAQAFLKQKPLGTIIQIT